MAAKAQKEDGPDVAAMESQMRNHAAFGDPT